MDDGTIVVCALKADRLLLLTDVATAMSDYGATTAEPLHHLDVAELEDLSFPGGSVIAWTTEYYGLAVETMRREPHRRRGTRAHLPVHSETISFLGTVEADIEGEFVQFSPAGYRPPRIRDPCSEPIAVAQRAWAAGGWACRYAVGRLPTA